MTSYEKKHALPVLKHRRMGRVHVHVKSTQLKDVLDGLALAVED